MPELTPNRHHTPIPRREGVIDCTCRYRQEGIYATQFGARIAFLEHVVSSIVAEQGWPMVAGVDAEANDA